MAKNPRYRSPLNSGNDPGNPLRSYRMSMLSHGFLPDADGMKHELNPDEAESLTYSVGPLHRTASPLRVVVAVLSLVAIVVVAVVVIT
jgi:hypothetical protein